MGFARSDSSHCDPDLQLTQIEGRITWSRFSLIDQKAVEAAIGGLDRHFAALNAGDTVVLANASFSHYRLAGSSMQVWEHPENYLRDFRLRVGNDWHHSAWDFRNPLCSSREKVHLDTQFGRYRAGGSFLGRYRSTWIITCIDGRWAAQLRSSFAT